MKLRFLGDVKKLEKCVSRTGITGEWREIPKHQVQYRTDDDAILNWWESTGTVAFQGPKLTVRRLKGAFVRVALKKGLLEGGRDRVEEIADLQRQMKSALIDIAKLKEAGGVI
jgi:hypothetical protein